MKRIAAVISGRLGNQMFQYAFVRALMHLQTEDTEIVFNFKRVLMAGKSSDGFEDSLRYFNIQPYSSTDRNLVLTYGTPKQILLYLLYIICVKIRIIPRSKNEDFWYPLFRSNGLLYSSMSDNRHTVYEHVFEEPRPKTNYICSGKYENPMFFDHIRPILLNEFTPMYPPLAENATLYDVIEQTNSVCVSIRRGDFLSPKNKKSFFICDGVYFQKAIEVVKEKIEKPTLIFFSDDIEWVKEHVKTEIPSYYESGNDPVWEKLRLMYSCKHFVISNSTFSWWAQYLSRNKDKVVVAPNRWHNNETHNGDTHLLLDNFIKI
jgi:tellurite resistance-related uncharacterized protein